MPLEGIEGRTPGREASTRRRRCYGRCAPAFRSAVFARRCPSGLARCGDWPGLDAHVRVWHRSPPPLIVCATCDIGRCDRSHRCVLHFWTRVFEWHGDKPPREAAWLRSRRAGVKARQRHVSPSSRRPRQMMPLERTAAFTFVCVAGVLPHLDDRAPWAVQPARRPRTPSTNLCRRACDREPLLGAALRLHLSRQQ